MKDNRYIRQPLVGTSLKDEPPRGAPSGFIRSAREEQLFRDMSRKDIPKKELERRFDEELLD